MMRVVILSARTGWHTDELTRALTARGHLAAVVPYEGLIARVVDAGPRARLVDGGLQTRLTSEQISLLDADVVLARIIPGGSLEQLIYRVDALHWIENRGVRVVNSPRAIERSVDKFYTTTLLHEAGLLVPETVVCERLEDAMAAVRAMGDVVIKPIFGSLGHGMVRVSDPETALRVVRALDQIKSVFYVQRAIDHGGRDLRIFVVGGQVYLRRSNVAPRKGNGARMWRLVALRPPSMCPPRSSARRSRQQPRLVPTTLVWTCYRHAMGRCTCSR